MEPERCPECGFDGTRLGVADSIAALRSMGRRWAQVFEGVPDEDLRTRPSPDTWSALEYAAHTRDVIALLGRGVNRVLEGDHPRLAAVDPDPPGADHGYNDLDPARVLAELAGNAERMAERAERALPEHWRRTASIGEVETDAGWILRHAVHDASHHLRDVERGLRAVGKPPS